MAVTAPIGFSWVNYTNETVVKKDEEDMTVIKSHAMRVVHHQRHKPSQRKHNALTQEPRRRVPLKARIAKSIVPARDPFLYRPETDWEDLALCQFMHAFVYPQQTSADNAFQYLNFLPGLYSRYSKRSCLTEAVTAVSLALFSNQTRACDVSIRARESYTNALSLVNKSMQDPALRKTDLVLTTLCLLTKYEIVSGDVDNSDTWQSHEKGQAALICQRGEQQLQTEIGASLFRLVYIRQQLNCIARNQRPAMGLSVPCWELAFPMPYLRRLMKLIAKTANVRHAAAVYEKKLSKEPREACCIAEDALDVDTDMSTLIGDLPEKMSYHVIPNDVSAGRRSWKGYQPDTINIFQDLQHTSFWHVLWYGRLHILQTLLHYSAYQLNFQPEEMRLRLQQTVDDICSSVLFASGDNDCPQALRASNGFKSVTAHYLIWVLAAASTVPGVPDDQKAWISSRLRDIGYVQGIRQALVFA